MLENLKAIYAQYRWTKLVACLLLVGAGYILFQLAGGFPPWAWRFLFNVLPRLTSLWATPSLFFFVGIMGDNCPWDQPVYCALLAERRSGRKLSA